MVFISLIISLPFSIINAKEHNHREKCYQTQWCKNNFGIEEVVCPDHETRSDCLTSTHVIEVDFANNFYQAIGQSLYYSYQFETKRAGIVLIIENEDDYKYLFRLYMTVTFFNLPIDIWEIRSDEIEGNFNNDNNINLVDAIIGLQVISNIGSHQLECGAFTNDGRVLDLCTDINDDDKIEITEIVYILKQIADKY